MQDHHIHYLCCSSPPPLLVPSNIHEVKAPDGEHQTAGLAKRCVHEEPTLRGRCLCLTDICWVDKEGGHGGDHGKGECEDSTGRSTMAEGRDMTEEEDGLVVVGEQQQQQVVRVSSSTLGEQQLLTEETVTTLGEGYSREKTNNHTDKVSVSGKETRGIKTSDRQNDRGGGSSVSCLGAMLQQAHSASLYQSAAPKPKMTNMACFDLEATPNKSSKSPLGGSADVVGGSSGAPPPGVEIWLLVDMDKSGLGHSGWVQKEGSTGRCDPGERASQIWKSVKNNSGGIVESKESVVVKMLKKHIRFSRVFLSIEDRATAKKNMVCDNNSKTRRTDDNEGEPFVDRCRWLLGRVSCSMPEEWPRYTERVDRASELAPEYRVYDTKHRPVPVDYHQPSVRAEDEPTTAEELWSEYEGDMEAIYRIFSSSKVSRGKKAAGQKKAPEESESQRVEVEVCGTSRQANLCVAEWRNYQEEKGCAGGGASSDDNPPCLQMFARSPERHLRASSRVRTQRFLVIGSSRLMRTMIQTALHRRMGNMVRNGSLSILSLQTVTPSARVYRALHRLKPPSDEEAVITAGWRTPNRLQQQHRGIVAKSAEEEEQEEDVIDWVSAAGRRCYLEVFNERISPAPIITYPPGMFVKCEGIAS
eukprot:GHVS01108078.1.p1 GENE.GHVS01108078.1~~GHVS01108078.1.p1  ORF type:complete len:643 (+),score=133.43 GHVS01108078.1:363-2291(+)